MTAPATIVFVYNADSGVFNLLSDIAHKAISPKTYKCNLCALTHTPLAMRSEWKAVLDGLGHPLEFLHRDEFRAAHDDAVALPAVLLRRDADLMVLLDAATIDAATSMDDLRDLLVAALRRISA